MSINQVCYNNIQILMSVLPPGLESMSSHTFGSLYLQILNLKTTKNIQPTHFAPQFFGQLPDENVNSSNHTHPHMEQIGDIMQYKIVTHQWLFYLYLSDMEHIRIYMVQGNGKNSGCFIQLPVELRSAKQVMTPQFKQKNILKWNEPRQESIVDNKGNTYGTATVKIWTEFIPDIHEEIKQLVNFGQMVVFQGISPINSQTELPRSPPQQLSAITVRTTKTETDNKYPNMLDSPQEPSLEHIQPSQSQQPEHQQQQQHKTRLLMQDDIDRMIAQMQNKPYDCSRYQDVQPNKHPQHTQSSCSNQYERSNSHQQIKSNTYSIMSGFNKTEDYHQNSNKFQETQASLKHSMARPPSYSPLRTKPKIDQLQQTVINKSPHILKASQTSIPQMQSQLYAKPEGSSSYLQLKIHDMLVSISNALPHTLFGQLMQQCYSIKVYLNSDQEEYFAAQGIKQGQIIIFNQSLKIRNIAHLKSIRFTISDDYGKVECQGIFDLTRLYASKEMKGVFTVPLLAFGGNLVQSKLRVAQNKLLQVSPLHRTLRIEAELVQKIQMVQIFMKIWKISIPSSLIRYKIPMTKQTIEQVGGNHVSIFPHTCSQQVPDKIIVEFWKNEQNIGQSQISLKNIKNTNVNILNSNVDPTYLYDGKKQIRNMLEGDRIVGDFMLTVCFGTVKQMQSLLLTAINQQKQIMQQQQGSRVQATLDERLGIIVNKKPMLNEISVQVQMQSDPHPRQMTHDPKFNGEPSFGDQSMISHNSHNEFMDGSLVSFAKHQQQQQAAQQQQLITKVQQKPTINYPTVTQKVGQTISELLSSVVPILPRLKQLCKPHLVYNFINADKLKQIMVKLGVKNKIVEMVFKLVLFVKTDMVNVNNLYDLIMSVQIEGAIKANFISDQMLIVGAMRLLYGRESLRKNMLMESQMQFKQMAELYKKVQLKLTLHEYNTLQKFICKYKTKQQAEELKAAIIRQLESQTVAEIQECFYEQDILKQIYGDQSSSMNSFNYSHPAEDSAYLSKPPIKQQIEEEQMPRFSTVETLPKMAQKQRSGHFQRALETKKETDTSRKYEKQERAKSSRKQNCSQKISIEGVESAIESVECVFDKVPEKLSIKIVIESPISQQIKFQTTQQQQTFTSGVELKDADGKMHLMSKNTSIACAAFSLIKGVKSLYALKTNEGQFCGLLHLLLQ